MKKIWIVWRKTRLKLLQKEKETRLSHFLHYYSLHDILIKKFNRSKAGQITLMGCKLSVLRISVAVHSICKFVSYYTRAY